MVKYSDPPTALVFSGFPPTLRSQRNETEVEVVIQEALIEACSEKRDGYMNNKLRYWGHESGSVFLGLEPKKVVPAKVTPPWFVGPRWGIWVSALIGINKFRTAYPGLDFEFRIYIEQGGFDEFYAAFGMLWDPLRGDHTVENIQTF